MFVLGCHLCLRFVFGSGVVSPGYLEVYLCFALSTPVFGGLRVVFWIATGKSW